MDALQGIPNMSPHSTHILSSLSIEELSILCDSLNLRAERKEEMAGYAGAFKDTPLYEKFLAESDAASALCRVIRSAIQLF